MLILLGKGMNKCVLIRKTYNTETINIRLENLLSLTVRLSTSTIVVAVIHTCIYTSMYGCYYMYFTNKQGTYKFLSVTISPQIKLDHSHYSCNDKSTLII